MTHSSNLCLAIAEQLFMTIIKPCKQGKNKNDYNKNKEKDKKRFNSQATDFSFFRHHLVLVILLAAVGQYAYEEVT
jgi:hypothetical protein